MLLLSFISLATFKSGNVRHHLLQTVLVAIFQCGVRLIVLVFAVNFLRNQLDLLLLCFCELVVHDLLVFGAVDVAQIFGSEFVARIELRNLENRSQHAINRVEVIVDHCSASL